MKKIIYLLIAALPLLAACDPEAEYEVKKATVKMEIKQVSAGFCEVSFTTNKPAYYLIGIEPVIEGADLDTYEDQVKNILLDSAYMEYIVWRHDLLLDGIHDIAEFKDHGLQYGNTDRFFQFLTPDTDYWVFCFIVDAETNKPAGELHYITIHTTEESVVPMHFNYRINGTWDYVYPLDQSNNLLVDVPWVGATVDSLDLRKEDWRVPGEFFADTFAIISKDRHARVLYGIYSHNNDGVGDGTSSTRFVEGHTYYTGVASLDGSEKDSFVPKYYDIFRFTWTGNSMQLLMTHENDNTFGAW